MVTTTAQVSVHESGHATISLFLDLPLVMVTIIPQGNMQGRVVYDPDYINQLNFGLMSDEDRDIQCKRLLLAGLAGPAAERRYAGGHDATIGDSQDRLDEYDLLDNLGPRLSNYRDFKRFARRHAASLVNSNWGRIIYMAKILYRHETLSASDVRRIIS